MTNEITTLLQGIPCSCQEFSIGATTVALYRTVEHNILFNTGPYSERVLLTAKLKEQGLNRGDIDILVLSQLHWDTAINIDMFKDAEIYVHESELDYAKKPADGDIMTPPFLEHFIHTMPKLKTIKGDIEILPEVKIVELPGVSPGSIGLLIGSSLLAGDAVPTIRSAYKKEIVGYNVNAALANSSLKKALNLAEIIYPGHDRPFVIKEAGIEILGEIDLRIRFFFSPKNQDQEIVVKSEKQLTFVTWPN
jgi:glyoxylase-like metal-dependent hydrolase (beta-lactamase superfamily II)